ncbi:DUF5752 family protein [Candidatus Zixiibacteriota bacterium]
MKLQTNPFLIKDCALIAIATGERAYNLRELRDNLRSIHPDSIYYHFWGGLLRPRFDDPEFNNDFAAWASHSLHDKKLAECLGIIDPTDFSTLEALRQELIMVIEERMDEIEYLPWAQRDQRFDFIRSQIIIFDTAQKVFRPPELVKAVPGLSVGSIFYHFIDARRRTPNVRDDFTCWLEGFGDSYAGLRHEIDEIDPYFSTLTELREELTSLFREYFEESNK